MKKSVQRIRTNHPFFKGMPQVYKDILLVNSHVESKRAGQTVFNDGEKADKFFLILDGKIEVLTEEQDVRIDPELKMGVLCVLGPGEIVGWSWIIPPYRWKFNARAKEKTKLLALNGVHIRELMQEDHSLAYQVYKRLVPVMNKRLVASRAKLAMYGVSPFETEEGG